MNIWIWRRTRKVYFCGLMPKVTNNTSPNFEMMLPIEALTRFKPELHKMSMDNVEPESEFRYGFRIGSIGFLLPKQENAEIIEQMHPCAIPNTPQWLKGVINVRGNLVPIFDMCSLLGLEEEQQSERLLILGQGYKAVGLYIDALPMIVERLEKVESIPPVPELLINHMRGLYMHNKDIWLDLSFDDFFTELGERLN